MKTNVFYSKLSSAKLQENLEKQFGSKVNLNKYDREQLEDIRNKLRTRIFQQEGSAGINDLLTNETYQKDKAMLELLNTRIKEMLGEQMKQLRDKMDQLTEAKKAKKADKDYDGDGKIETPKDEVWGSRAKAAAKAGKPFQEAAKKMCAKCEKPADMCKCSGKTFQEAAKKMCAKCKKSETACKCPVEEGFPGADYKSQIADKPGTKTGHDSKKTTTGTVYTKKATKAEPVDKDTKAKKVKETAVAEAKPSAGMTAKEKSAVVKKARAGKDIGKPGKGFAKVEKAAAKGGARDPKAVAAAAMWKQQAKESRAVFKQNVKFVNESIEFFLKEDEEAKAKTITAAGDMVNDFTSWMQRVGQYQTKAIIELADEIRSEFGAAEAETFKQTVAPALSATLETLTQQREAISNAVATLAGEAGTEEPMGMEPEEPGMDLSAPDEMNAEPAGDEFGASDAAAGGAETSGREMREGRAGIRARKLAESHSIMSKLAK